MGYGIVAVPTGIVTLELNEANRRQANTREPALTARQKAILREAKLLLALWCAALSGDRRDRRVQKTVLKTIRVLAVRHRFQKAGRTVFG